MPPCANRIRRPVRAETFTGLSRDNIICAIGKRTDIKHFVSISHPRLYPVPVEVLAQITSERRFIRFEQHPDHEELNVDDSEWWIRWVVGVDETLTGFVNLRSSEANGKQQDIVVSLQVLENDAQPQVSFAIAVLA